MKGISNAPKMLHSNKNLLDNWDFTNPIDQRNFIDSSVHSIDKYLGYGIDRWFIHNVGSGSIGTADNIMKQINSDNGRCVKINLTGLYSFIAQSIELHEYAHADEYTFSILFDGTILQNTDTNMYIEMFVSELPYAGGDTRIENISQYLSVENLEPIVLSKGSMCLTSATLKIPDSLVLNNKKYYLTVCLINGTERSSEKSLVATKLEKGKISTLKNDALGMSYYEELRKCQRYFLNINALRVKGDIAVNSMAVHAIQFPCAMRAIPVVYKTKTKSMDSVNQPFTVEPQSNTSATLVVSNNLPYDANYDGGVEYAMFSAEL